MNAPSKRVARRLPPRPRDEEAEVEEQEERAERDESNGLHEGWSEGEKQLSSTSSYAQIYKPGEKSDVIKFLEDRPYVSFRRHWIETPSEEGGKAKNRPYYCLRTKDLPCPLCDIGDNAQAVACFNIAIVGDDGQLILRSWEIGSQKMFKQLNGFQEDSKIGPLTRGFFLVKKTGSYGTANTSVTPIRASALEEDYDTPVPDQEALDRIVKYTKDIVEIPPKKKLEALAAELADDYG